MSLQIYRLLENIQMHISHTAQIQTCSRSSEASWSLETKNRLFILAKQTVIAWSSFFPWSRRFASQFGDNRWLPVTPLFTLSTAAPSCCSVLMWRCLRGYFVDDNYTFLFRFNSTQTLLLINISWLPVHACIWAFSVQYTGGKCVCSQVSHTLLATIRS